MVVYHESTTYRRSSHEERGLKSGESAPGCRRMGRSSHEERGLKCLLDKWYAEQTGRSSHEERGLKLQAVQGLCNRDGVAPRMRSVD